MEDEVLANAGVDVFEELFKLIFTKLYDEMESGRDTRRHLVFKNYGDTETELKAKIQDLYAFRGRDRAPQDCMPDSSSLSDQAALPCIAEFMDPAAVMASPHRDDGQSRLAP
jgi:hypothetical protein